MDVGVWVPSRRYLERLKFQLEFDPRRIEAAEMFTDIEEEAGDLMFDSPPPPPPPAQPANYLAAEQELRDALRHSSRGKAGPERRRHAREQFAVLLEKEVIRPLFRPTGSANARNLQVALMQSSRLLHRLGIAIDEGLTRRPVEALLRSAEPIPRGQLQQ